MKHRPIGPCGRFALLATVLTTFTPGLQAAADPKASRYYEEALVRYEKRDLAGAIIQLKNSLQIDRNQLAAQVLLGKALLANGEAIAAEVAFNEALRLGVNRAELVIPMAETYLAMGKQSQLLTEAAFNPVGLPPDIRRRMLLIRASASADVGDTRVAMTLVEDARSLDPRAADSFIAEVPIRIRGGQIREAEAAADRALAMSPNSAEAAYQKGAVLHQRGALQEALVQYGRAVASDGAHAEARVSRAGLYLDLGRLPEAAVDLAELKKISPLDPRAAYLRALVAERENRSPEVTAALREVTNLLDQAPADFFRYRPQLLLLNGLAHLGLKETAKAKPLLEAVQRTQGTTPATKLLGQLYLSEREAGKAVSILESYLKVNPGDFQAITLLAAAHMAEGRDARAASLMQEALKANDAPETRTSLGLSLINMGRVEDAVPHFEAAFKKDSGLIPAGTALVGLYMKRNQAAKAVPVAEAMTRRRPESAGLHDLLGLARLAVGNTTSARSAFEKALQVNAGFEPAQFNLIRLDINSKAYDAAEQRLNAILRKNERNAEALYEMAALNERRGRKGEILGWLEKAARYEAPDQIQAGLGLVAVHLAQQRPQQAIEAAKAISTKAPSNPETQLALARAQLAANDPSGARQTLTGATRMANYHAPTLVRIAALQIAAGHLQDATYSLDKAKQGDPGFLPTVALLNDLDLRQGNFHAAEARARQVADRHPKLAFGHLLLGDVAMARRQRTPALEAYRRAHQVQPTTMTLLKVFGVLAGQDGGAPAIQLAEQWIKANPKDAEVTLALADAKARAGDFSGARRAYETLIALSPDNASAMNNLANVLFQLKDPGAMKMAEAALAKSPGDANIIDTIGWFLLQSGQTDRALQQFRDARLRAPENPEIRYHLAEALARSGRKAEAKEELQNALKTGGAFPSRVAAQALFEKL
jgi:cellulose synthase operon protein C